MGIFCKELNQEFKNKQELFDALRKSHEQIISAKKAEIYKSAEKGISLTAKPIDPLKLGTQIKGISIDNEFFYIAVNSTKILDTHRDLHLNGIWKKTVKEQQGKVYLVDTHSLKVVDTIARKEHIEIFTAIIPFSLLNKTYKGDTEVLIYKIRKDKIINPLAKEWLQSGDEIEASVRMQYVEILFALNSDDKDDVKFKANYDKYIKEVANIDDFDTEIIYFWPVKEAKNVLESSLVLFGSNSTTGTIEERTKFEPPEGTQKQDNEPPEGTRNEKKEFYLSLLKN